MKKHKGLVFVFIVVAVAIITYMTLNIFFSPYWDSVYPPTGYLSFASLHNAESDTQALTYEEACEDIDYLVKRIGRTHPICADGVPDNITQAADREKSSFGDSVSMYEIWRSCARVMHELNDPHSMAMGSFPMNYLTEHTDMIDSGAELLSINGKTVSEIFADNKDILSYELEPWGEELVKGLVGTREGLIYLGIYDDELAYSYKTDGSTEEKIYVKSDFYNAQAAGLEEEADPPYSYEILKDKNAGVFTLESCVYDMDFKETLYNFFSEVNENGITNVVIDLRGNTGGTSQVLEETLVYLDHDTYKTPGGKWRLGSYMMTWEPDESHITHMDGETLFAGNVYVLTSSGTFSAATQTAAELRDNDFALIVGEAAGNKPAGYGDVAVFETPNAAVAFQISTKYLERVDNSKADEPLVPDFETDCEKALEKALEIIK